MFTTLAPGTIVVGEHFWMLNCEVGFGEPLNQVSQRIKLPIGTVRDGTSASPYTQQR